VAAGLKHKMGEMEHQHELDARGLFCPEPVMLLHNKIREMKAGEVLRLVATDPSTERDVPKFCNFLGHPLVKAVTKEKEFHYWIQKKPA